MAATLSSVYATAVDNEMADNNNGDAPLPHASYIGIGYQSKIRDPTGTLESELIFNHSNRAMNEEGIDDLRQQGYTEGLIDALRKNTIIFPLRIWILDNSGSMNKNDGRRIVVTTSGKPKRIPCTRWGELQGCMSDHLSLLETMRTPTVLRFLNDPGIHVSPQRISVTDNNMTTQDSIQRTVAAARAALDTVRPDGMTPLSSHIQDVAAQVKIMEPQLSGEGKRVAVVLTTDGLPAVTATEEMDAINTECQDFHEALMALSRLPVWLVIRLCTTDEHVVQFYGSLDTEMEISVDVLSDYMTEAEEVYRYNKWLNYGLPLHRCREMGLQHRILDLLDERAFTGGEVKEFCSLLFGIDELPHPIEDWPEFKRIVENAMRREMKHFNPIKMKKMMWIDMKELAKMLSKGRKDCVLM